MTSRAADLGFDWERDADVAAKIEEELEEWREAAAQEDRQAEEKEIGDLLLSVVNLARRRSIDPEAPCGGPTRDSARRFAGVARRAACREGRCRRFRWRSSIGIGRKRRKKTCDSSFCDQDGKEQSQIANHQFLPRELTHRHKPDTALTQWRQLALQHGERRGVGMTDRDRRPSSRARAMSSSSACLTSASVATSSRKTRRETTAHAPPVPLHRRPSHRSCGCRGRRDPGARARARRRA